MAKVSVIIPSYNSANTLPRAISSVLGQTYSDYEILVVDDGSDDNTKQVVDSYTDGRIQYIRHENNKGGSAARNTGLEFASGDYIAYLDADDEWLPKKLERQLSEIESRPDDWIAIYCERIWDITWRQSLAFRLAKIVGTKKYSPPKEGGKELIKEVMTCNLSTGASTLLVKSEFARELDGFDPEFPRHQDWEFLIRILKIGKLAHIDEPLVVKHDTGRPSPEVYKTAKQMLLSKFSDEVKRFEQQGHKITHIQKLELTKLYLANGDIQTAIQRLKENKISIREFASVVWYLPRGLYKSIKRSLSICNSKYS